MFNIRAIGKQSKIATKSTICGVSLPL